MGSDGSPQPGRRILDMKTIIIRSLALLFFAAALHAQVPQLVNYQGRVAVGTTNFNGSGSF